MLVCAPFGCDTGGVVFDAGAATPRGIIAVRWFDACGRGAGSGSGPVGRHRLGNNDALPAVVTYFCPAGEVQMTVPSGC